MHTMPAPTSRFHRYLRPGPIVMALGALLILGGIVQSTSSTNGGNQSCPSGTVLIAKFDYVPILHSYVFVSPAGNQHVVTLSHTSATGAWWASTQPVSALIVKGGPASVVYSISPPQVTGSFSNSGLPKVGHDKNHPDISNVQFCGSNHPTTTTTTKSTTTTSHPTTTTTVPSGTTTTTTCGECTTTTTSHPTTTTTCDCTTTTKHVTTTTCECTTTTTHPHETTTTVANTTTNPSTSSTEVSGSTLVVTTTTNGGTTTTKKSLGGETTVAGQGTSTSFGPTVSSTSVFKASSPGNLPFTGSSSTPLVALGIILLATGLTLTLSQARRRERTQG